VKILLVIAALVVLTIVGVQIHHAYFMNPATTSSMPIK
jgi:hypothetical protein